MIYQYPLDWPVGVPRTKKPTPSRFDTSEGRVKKGLERELSLMVASQIVITSNVELRRDGRPYANQQLTDTGVAVYFIRSGERRCIACDRWNSTRDNLQAVSKTVEALRGIERWGTAAMVEAAFRGFAALPAGAAVVAGAGFMTPARPWWEVLEISPTASKEIKDAAYKAKRLSTHPDKQGGSDAAFIEVERAYEEATQ